VQYRPPDEVVVVGAIHHERLATVLLVEIAERDLCAVVAS
jgi:hypothetical protein